MSNRGNESDFRRTSEALSEQEEPENLDKRDELPQENQKHSPTLLQSRQTERDRLKKEIERIDQLLQEKKNLLEKAKTDYSDAQIRSTSALFHFITYAL